MCLASAMVACLSLTQEKASSSPFTVIINDKYFVTEFAEFNETFSKNSIVFLHQNGMFDASKRWFRCQFSLVI